MAVSMLLQHGITQAKAAWPPYNQKLCPSMRQHGHILLQHGSKDVVAAWHKSNNGSMASLLYQKRRPSMRQHGHLNGGMASLRPETLPMNEAAWPYTVAAWQ